MTDDPILDRMLLDFPEVERDDPVLHDAIRGTFGYQRAKLEDAARAFGHEFSEQVGGAFRRIDERRNRALRRWWNDRR